MLHAAFRLLLLGGKTFAAFITGWVIYMLSMMMTVYDGFPSLVLQPFMGLIFSGLFVLIAVIAGFLLFLIPPIKRLWNSLGLLTLFIPILALGIMIFHAPLGLQETFYDPELERHITSIAPGAALLCTFAILFTIVHLPLRLPSFFRL